MYQVSSHCDPWIYEANKNVLSSKMMCEEQETWSIMSKIDKGHVGMVWRKIQGSKAGTVVHQWRGREWSSFTDACGNQGYPVWSDATVELLKLKMLKLPVDAGSGRDVSAYKAYRSLLLMLLLICRTIWVPVRTRSLLPKVLVVVMWAPTLHQVAMGISA